MTSWFICLISHAISRIISITISTVHHLSRPSAYHRHHRLTVVRAIFQRHKKRCKHASNVYFDLLSICMKFAMARGLFDPLFTVCRRLIKMSDAGIWKKVTIFDWFCSLFAHLPHTHTHRFVSAAQSQFHKPFNLINKPLRMHICMETDRIHYLKMCFSLSFFVIHFKAEYCDGK